MDFYKEKYNPDNMLPLFMKGDEKAYAYFFKLFIEDLYAYGTSLGGEEETVKDIIQDVFINIFSSKIEFKSSYHLKHYLLQSVKNKLYDIYRSPSYNKTTPIDDSTAFSISIDLQDEILDREQKAILKNKIEKILSVLTDRQKEVLFLRYSQELEYEGIAKILKMTVPASRKLVARAIKRLREEHGLLYIIILLMIKIQ